MTKYSVLVVHSFKVKSPYCKYFTRWHSLSFDTCTQKMQTFNEERARSEAVPVTGREGL
jgi:hypothetical protein